MDMWKKSTDILLISKEDTSRTALAGSEPCVNKYHFHSAESKQNQLVLILDAPFLSIIFTDTVPLSKNQTRQNKMHAINTLCR